MTDQSKFIVSAQQMKTNLGPALCLARMAQSSVEHNLELAWSGRLEHQFKQHNLQAVQEIKEYVGL